MLDLLYLNLPHVLCVLLLISRIGDIGTTYLLTPKLTLEANPVVRRLGWKFALVSLSLCIVPYFSTAIALSILVMFLMVSASNASGIWMARAVGEDEYLRLLHHAAGRSTLRAAVAGTLASAAFIGLVAAVILLFYPSAYEWGFWIAIGVFMYAFLRAFYGSLYWRRLYRQVATGSLEAALTTKSRI